MIRTALEETRLAIWKAIAFTALHIYNATGNRKMLRVGARYLTKIDGYIELKRMDEEENGGN